jgi:hypothetical protein
MALAGVVLVLRVLYVTREGILFRLDRIILGVLLGLVVYAVAVQAGRVTPQVAALAGIVVGAAVAAKKRSRRIPARVRREVIARDLRGKKFDSRKHHIDHTWPYSRGGSHTTDNLRVAARRENLRKGAKLPKLWDLFR